jgi:hypothetical protein
MFSSACLLFSLAILYFVLRYRVHIHINVTSSRHSSEARKGLRAADSSSSFGPTAMTRPAESVVLGDIASALVNLGAPKAQAKAAAIRAVREHPDADFNLQFSVALQEVGRAA